MTEDGWEARLVKRLGKSDEETAKLEQENDILRAERDALERDNDRLRDALEQIIKESRSALAVVVAKEALKDE